MTTTPILLYGGLMPGKPTDLYTAPATGTTIVTEILVTNPNPSTSISGTIRFNNNPVYSGNTFSSGTNVADIKQILGANQTLNASYTSSQAPSLPTSTGATSAQAFQSLATDGLGNWVAVGNGTTATTVGNYSTNNGLSWSTFTLPASSVWTSVAFGNGYFVAIASGGTNTAYSTTANIGSTWTAGATMPSSNTWTALSYGVNNVGVGTWVAIAGAGTAGTTASYITNPTTGTWSASTLPVSTNWRGVAYGLVSGVPTWVTVGSTGANAVAYSINGSTWTQGTIGTTSWYSICYAPLTSSTGTFVTGTQSATSNVQYSTNGGITWNSATSSLTTVSIINVSYGAGMVIANAGSSGWQYQQLSSTGTLASGSWITGSTTVNFSGSVYQSLQYGIDRFVNVSSGASQASTFNNNPVIYVSGVNIV